MQVFEVVELKEFPYMATEELFDGEVLADIFTEENESGVFIIIDHDTKRILTYNGILSSFKLQFYGGILAKMFRTQLRLFYRVHPLNLYPKDHEMFKEIMDKPLGAGRAKSIEKNDFLEEGKEGQHEKDLSVHIGLRPKEAIDHVNDLPIIPGFERKLLLIGNYIYTEEKIPTKFVTDEETTIQQVKLGKLNRGFTFFEGNNYSTRLLIKNRIVQGIEILVPEDKPMPRHEVQIPVIQEDKFRKSGSVDELMNAFHIPAEWTDEE